MSDTYNQFGPPPSEYPPLYPRMEKVGEYVGGVVQAVRSFQAEAGDERKPVLDIQITEASQHPELVGGIQSVVCGARSLWAAALTQRPEPGATVRITLESFSGQAKNFTMQVAGTAPAAVAPVAPAAPAAAPLPPAVPVAPPVAAPMAPAPAMPPAAPPSAPTPW